MAKTKENGNSKAKANGTPSSLQLTLSKPEQAALRKHDARITELKLELANVDLQIAGLEARRGELRATIMAAGQRYQDDVRAMARAKGIDVDRGVQLDVRAMTLCGEKA